MNCANCGHPIDDTTTICPHCGQPVEERAQLAPNTPLDDSAPVPALRLNASPPPEPARESRRRVYLLASAALVLIVILAGAGGAYLLNRTNQPPTAPAGATFAASSATETATAYPFGTARPGASTPSVTTTASPRLTATSSVPSPTATPEPKLVTLFSDSLTSNTHGWPVGGGCTFQSDGYQLSGPVQCGAPFNPPTSLNVSVTLQQTAGSSIIGYGIAFRAGSQPIDEYAFMISGSGEWYVARAMGGALIAPRSSAAIHKGLNQPNTMEVDMTGPRFTFYINSIAVGSATDSTYTSDGLALLIEPNDNSNGTTVTYTDFLVTQWQ